MRILLKFVKSYIFYVLTAFGASIGIIANVGVGSYNSMNLSLADASHIKVGTMISFFNLFFLLSYMFLTKFKYKYKYLIQVISVLMFGSLVNFFVYDILNVIDNLSHIQRVLMFSVGTIVTGLSCGMIVHYNVMTFPMESFCVRVAELTKLTFVKLRYALDICFVIVSLGVSFIFELPVYVREGTIISMFLLSYAMNLAKSFAEKRISCVKM